MAAAPPIALEAPLAMKIYIQTEIHALESLGAEVRPRQFVLETAEPGPKVAQMLGAITQHLGRIAAIPAIAHESNLQAILVRDLATHGILPGESPGGEAVLRVIRREGQTGPAGQTDVTALDYAVETA
jgi:hypothetical protein